MDFPDPYPKPNPNFIPPPIGTGRAGNVGATGEYNYRALNPMHSQNLYNTPPHNPTGWHREGRGPYAGEGYPLHPIISDIRPMPGVDYVPRSVYYTGPVAPPIHEWEGFAPQTLYGGAGMMSGGPPPIMYIYIYIYI